MALITTEGTLRYRGPMYDGMTTRFGLSRDWRFDKKTWQYRFCEFIDPLNACAPWGRHQPLDMSIATWVPNPADNQRFRDWYATGNPTALGALFYDGTAYAATTAISTYAGVIAPATGHAYLPNVSLFLKRYTPPPGQGVIPQAALSLHAEYLIAGVWTEARVALWLPYAAENYKQAFLHCYVGGWTDTIDVLADGQFLSQGPATGANAQGMHEESWAFEYLETWRDASGNLYGEYGAGRTFLASHILIRKGDEWNNWWHYTSRELRLTSTAHHVYANAGKWSVTVAGAMQWVNVTPITYGSMQPPAITPSASYTFPSIPRPIPDVTPSGGDATAWNDDPTWDALVADVAYWTVTVVEATDGTQRPLVTMTPAAAAQHNRPVVWFATEEHPAVIADTQDDTEDTLGTNALKSMRITRNKDWKGASASVVIYPDAGDAARFDTFRVNAKCDLHIGWQAGAGIGLAQTKLAEQYIKPDGIIRGRDGDAQTAGAPWLHIELGDFAEVRASRKQIMDMRQAAGMTVTAWAEMIANRMGIDAATLLYVDAAVAAQVIQPNIDIPSAPTLAPHDGQGFLDHIRDVEKAADIRVGFNKYIGSGLSPGWKIMFVDAGPPVYPADAYHKGDGLGSIVSFEIDYNTALEDKMLYTIVNQPSGENFRNVLKAVYGRPVRPFVISDKGREDWYWAESLTIRKDTIGDDWPIVIEDTSAASAGDIAKRFAKDNYRWQGRIHYVGPLRNDIGPDAFIKVTDCPGIELEVDWIYQVTQTQHEADFDGLDGTLTIDGLLVYPVYAEYY